MSPAHLTRVALLLLLASAAWSIADPADAVPATPTATVVDCSAGPIILADNDTDYVLSLDPRAP